MQTNKTNSNLPGSKIDSPFYFIPLNFIFTKGYFDQNKFKRFEQEPNAV